MNIYRRRSINREPFHLKGIVQFLFRANNINISWMEVPF
jgi:hypothetical protein